MTEFGRPVRKVPCPARSACEVGLAPTFAAGAFAVGGTGPTCVWVESIIMVDIVTTARITPTETVGRCPAVRFSCNGPLRFQRHGQQPTATPSDTKRKRERYGLRRAGQGAGYCPS